MMHRKIFPRVHQEAIGELFSAAFPYASLVFPTTQASQRCAVEPLSHLAASSFNELQLSKTFNTTSVEPVINSQRIPSCLEDVRACMILWRHLYHRFWGPVPTSQTITPGSYPRCPVLVKKAAEDPVVPGWVPDAVVFISGYEPTDLRRVVFPQLIKHLPPIEESVRRSKLDSTAQPGLSPLDVAMTATSVLTRRRPPAFLRSFNCEREAFAHKGCIIHGNSLLEIQLPVSQPCSRGTRRVRTYVIFANPSVTLTELLREPQANRRAFLRHSFGYSLPLLQQALPRPMVLAAIAIKEWQSMRERGTVLCSDDFWLSCIAHVLSSERWAQLLAVELDKETSTACTVSSVGSTMPKENACIKCVKRRFVRGCSCLGENLTSLVSQLQSGVPSEMIRADGAKEEWMIASILAKSTLQAVGHCEDRGWKEVFLRNFFLPQETFLECPDDEPTGQMRKTCFLQKDEFSLSMSLYNTEQLRIVSDSKV